MALEISLFGLIVQDMQKSLEFYRRLGPAIPEGSEENTHVEVKMETDQPSSWTPTLLFGTLALSRRTIDLRSTF